MTEPATLAELIEEIAPEPIICGRFWRNRSGHEIRVQLRKFANRDLVEIRSYYTAKDGTMQPSPQGVAFSVRRLPDIHNALTKALRKARELGMLRGTE